MRHDEGGRARPRAILIAGPTASGKSALAAMLAERLGGLIVNADSMQVYRDLPILTSQPTDADRAAQAHALYGSVDGTSAYSVSRWLSDAKDALCSATERGLVPIVVGGTGLYLKALTQGLSAIPAVPAQIRQHWRAWAEGRSPQELHAELARRDAETAARLRPTDPQRVLRALEVHAATGESLAAFQSRREPPLLPTDGSLALRIEVDRAVLGRRIDMRFDAMIAGGALAEVERLLGRRLDRTLPVMRAIGVPELASHLAGDLSLDAAIHAAKAATRRYVKRQETFARHQLSGFLPTGDPRTLECLQSSA